MFYCAGVLFNDCKIHNGSDKWHGGQCHGMMGVNWHNYLHCILVLIAERSPCYIAFIINDGNLLLGRQLTEIGAQKLIHASVSSTNTFQRKKTDT